MAIQLHSSWQIQLFAFTNTRGEPRYSVRFTNTERARRNEIELKPYISPHQALMAGFDEIAAILEADSAGTSIPDTAGR